MLIYKLICPLPDISHHIGHSKDRITLWVCVHVIWTTKCSSIIHYWYKFGMKGVSPWVYIFCRSLRCILPLPFIGKSLIVSYVKKSAYLPCPLGIGTNIFERNPCYWFIVPMLRIISIYPIL